VCSYALRADGEPSYNDEGRWLLLTNPRHRHVVLGLAADRYPVLAALRPTRRPGDPDCPSCGGTGRLRVPKGVKAESFICECGGLGWFPAGTELGPS
jgi:hypothetical protein